MTGFDFSSLMQKAQEMQGRVTALQEKLATEEITGKAGGDLVQVTLSGKGEAKRVRIDRSLLKADEGEILEDLLAAAINDARQRLDRRVQDETQRLMGGLPLPPGMNPFV